MVHPVRDRIGRYQLVQRLAVGGMGEIFLGRERGLAGFDRQVVVKLLLPELAEQAELRTLFIDEARIAANLTHPNIVQVYEFGQQDGSYYLAMEYVPGQNLSRIASRALKDPRAPLTRELAIHIVAEMARGLEYVHRAHDAEGRALGIVHRDVSPHNLLLSVHGDVKVMDFGIAKASNALHRTATGVVRGKFAYMSPEQLVGEPIDATTDVYSAGVMLWELTLMRRLWTGKDELAVIEQARAARVPRPRDIDPSYPPDLEEIVMQAVRRDRTQRTPTAGALESDLRGWLALHGVIVERSALGRLVTELFPEIDHVAPARVGVEAEPRTAPLSPPAPAASLPERPAASRSEPSNVPTVADRPALMPAAPSAPGVRRAVRLGLALGAVVALAGTGYAIATLRAEHHETISIAPSTSGTPSTPTAPSAAAESAAAGVADRAVASVSARDGATGDAGAPAAAVAAGSAVSPPSSPSSHRPRREGRAGIVDTTRSPPSPTQPAISGPSTPPATGTTPATVATAAASAEGWLVVEVTPWGAVTVPGYAHEETTPKRVKVPAGSYVVTAQVAGGKRVSATAKVEPNGTTKCRGDEAGLQCGH